MTMFDRIDLFSAFSRSLYRHATRRKIVPLLLLFAAYFWVFNFSTLPFSNPSLMAAGCGEGLLDIRPFYTAVEAHRALDCYGPAGRSIYQHFLLVDMSFVFIYGFGFALLLSSLLAALTTPESRWRLLNLLPLGIALADATENFALFALLAAYPGFPATLGELAGMATLFKNLLSVTALATLVVCACARLLLHIRRTK